MRAFTLIELLIVISIIAILAVVGINTFTGTRDKVNDSKKKADIDTIFKTYETTYNPSTGLYRPLLDSDFTSNKIPTLPEGGQYQGLITSSQNGYQICATLSNNQSICKQSAQGQYIAVSSPSPSPSPSPTPTPPGPTPTPNPTPASTITLDVAVSGDCFDTTNGCTYGLGVICQGLAKRQVRVKEIKPATAVGGILFTTGTWGVGFYSVDGVEPSATVQASVSQGLQTFELNWMGTNGWGTGVLGSGYKNAMCAYASVARWIHDNRMTQPGVMCAHGNSGGGMQISYSLSVYGLEDILDMAVISGGPPTADLEQACFGTVITDGAWDSQPSGRLMTDQLMGWTDAGESYCQLGSGPSSAHTEALSSSIAPLSEPRDFNYPSSKINFVEGMDDPIRWNGKIYHDRITSQKNFEVLAGVGHGVSGSPIGASRIRQLISTECRAW